MCHSGARRRGAAPNLCYSKEIGDQDNANAATCRRHRHCTRPSIGLIAVALLIACGQPQGAAAQTTCTITNSTVALSGAGASCTIPTATLTGGSPTVAASNSAAITTNSNSVTISPNNGGSTGALAQTLGTIIFGSGSIITGNFATAASAQTGGQIIFQPGSVINPATGGGEIALLADGVGAGGQSSQITATGLTVNLNGNGGDVGAKASGGGSILLNQGTTISFPPGGGGNIGLLATGANSQIVANGISDTMVGVGGGDVGVNADLGGKVTLTNSSVSDVGNGGGESGLKATNSGSIVTSGGSVSVVNGEGGLLQNGGTITMDGTNVTASGNGGNGFIFNSGANPNTLQYSSGTIVASGASFLVQGGATANIGLAGATATVNNGTLLQTSGTTTFNTQGSTLQGMILTQGGTSTVNLAGQTRWTMTGNSNATSLTNNNSEIVYAPPTGAPTLPSSYKTLTANNYGGTGGTITLNTFLGNDSSPSDRLVVNGGTATGSTAIRIVNTTGPGDQTLSNGILVVQTVNNATTATGAFSLAGEVRGGAYDYFLFRGGLGGSAPNDWFLRSTFDMGPTPPEPPDVIPPPILPPEPPPSVLPPGKFPIIGPELATYGVVQPIARQMGLTALGTLHERVGDAAADAACLNATLDSVAITKAPVLESNCRPAAWGRLFGQQIDNHYQAFADPRASGQVAGIQTGLDVWRGSLIPGHSDTAGLYFAYGNGNVGVDGLVTNAAATAYILQHAGSLNLNANSFGGYWTHYGPSGWYIDAVLQGSFYNGDAATQFANLPTNGTGFISSLEAGYPIPLPWFGPRFVLEPEGQIIWQQVSFRDDNDGLGPVGLGTTSGASGRLGLRGKWTINDPAGRVWQPYVLANVWCDWGAGVNTMFVPDSVLLVEQATRLEFAGGLSAKILPGHSLYAQAGYQFAVSGTDGGRRDGVKGNFGAHYTW
jgi:outer membrane autotransporter protein